jgi:hypothetical protein
MKPVEGQRIIYPLRPAQSMPRKKCGIENRLRDLHRIDRMKIQFIDKLNIRFPGIAGAAAAAI